MDDSRDNAFLARFRTVLERIGMLQRAADLVGMSTDQVAKWRDGKSRPPFGPLAILCQEAGVSLDWLAFGGSDPEISGGSMTNIAADDDVIMVPFLNVYGSAGPGVVNDGIEIVTHVPFSRKLMKHYGVTVEGAHAITARGDSMVPTIADGEIVLVDASVRKVRQDAIYVISIDDDIRIKRVQKSVGGSLTLTSDNPMYGAETLSPVDAEKLRVEGRVFWVEKLL